MAVLLFANNARSTLLNAISAGATSITLAAGGGAAFPTPGAGEYFLATFVDAATGLLNEIVQCTAISGDVMTIVRAQEGTSAQTWNAGDFVNNFWTAGSAEAMLQQGQYQTQSANYAVDSGAVNAMIITLNPAPLAMSDLLGAPIRVKVANTTTLATPTININGFGNKNIKAVNASGVVAPGVASFAAGEIVTLVWDGTQMQYQGRLAPATTAQIQAGTDALQPVTSAGIAAAFAFSTTTGAGGQGYQKFPGGLIMQWGNYQMSGTTIDITLPTAFPNASISTVCGTDSQVGVWTGVQGAPLSGSTLTTIRLAGWAGANPVATAVSGAWVAFGK